MARGGKRRLVGTPHDIVDPRNPETT